MVLLYKTNEFEGDLISSKEGHMEWVAREDLSNYNLVNDLFDLLKVFDDNNLSEFQYVADGDQWVVELK